MGNRAIVSTEDFFSTNKSTVSASSPKIVDTDDFLRGDLQPGTANQASGDIPTKSTFLKFLPTKEQLPEFLLSMLGGLAKRTPTGMALSAGGAMAGEAIRQGVFEENPLTVTERAKKLGFAGLRGLVGESVGRGIGKLFTPFSGSVTPEVTKGIQAAERTGVELPLSAMTESPKVQALERYTEFGLFGSKVTARKKAAIQELENVGNRISAEINPDLPPEVIGENISKSTKDFELAFRKTKDVLYEPINKVLNDKPVDPQNTINAIKTVLDRRGGGKEGRALLQDWLERLQPGTEQAERVSGRYIPAKEKIIDEGVEGMLSPKVVETTPGRFIESGGRGAIKVPSDIPSLLIPKELPSFGQLKAIRTEIGSRGNFNDPGVVGLKSDLEYIYSQASKDMDGLANQYGMKDALDAVNKQYSKGIKKLQDSLIKAVNKRVEKSPESLHKMIILNDSPSLIKIGREMLGDDGFNQLRKQWFDDLIERSKSVIEGEEVLSPLKLANNLRKTGSSLPEIVSDNKELASKIYDFMDVSKALTRGKSVTSGSQTGFIISNLADIRNLFIAPLTTTNTGRKFLTTGFPIIGKAAEVTAQAGTQLAEQKGLGLGKLFKKK